MRAETVDVNKSFHFSYCNILMELLGQLTAEVHSLHVPYKVKYNSREKPNRQCLKLIKPTEEFSITLIMFIAQISSLLINFGFSWSTNVYTYNIINQ